MPLAQWIQARAAPKVIAVMLLGLACVQAPAATLRAQSGVVTYVVDGDTVWVQVGAHDKPLKVRLQGIDAPEICQAGGAQAQAALKSRLMGQTVTVTSSANDDYGRTVGTLRLQGEDMSRWMVANGHAWVYSYQHRKTPYTDDFNQAQAARRGVFSDAAAQEPRAFRKANGSCYVGKKRAPSYKKSSGF